MHVWALGTARGKANRRCKFLDNSSQYQTSLAKGETRRVVSMASWNNVNPSATTSSLPSGTLKATRSKSLTQTFVDASSGLPCRSEQPPPTAKNVKLAATSAGAESKERANANFSTEGCEKGGRHSRRPCRGKWVNHGNTSSRMIFFAC